jgi:hypothetical protein
MKKIITALLLVLPIYCMSAPEMKLLEFKYNSSTNVYISNQKCNFDKIKETHPLAAIAMRSDGAAMAGCYKKLNEDFIQIQWVGGDTSEFPANYFNTGRILNKPETPVGIPPKATM